MLGIGKPNFNEASNGVNPPPETYNSGLADIVVWRIVELRNSDLVIERLVRALQFVARPP
jgi:hypothetical protein